MAPRYLHSFASFFHALLLQTPQHNWWASILIWIVRVATLSLLLRTYLFPWAISLLSKHIRIKSVSFRSIRGLYIRRGSQIWKVDRISYAWRSRRMNIKVQGFSLDVDIAPIPTRTAPARRHARGLTLADFAPSPMAHRLWSLLSGVFALVEPLLRPVFRSVVVYCLHILIRWLPIIADALTFELYNTTISPTSLPGVEVAAQKIHLHMSLDFIQLASPDKHRENEPLGKLSSTPHLYGVAAWRKRLGAGFRRSLDRAWGSTEVNGSVTLTVGGLMGSMPPWASHLGVEKMCFLSIPGDIAFQASARFNPREGTVNKHSLQLNLTLGDCSVKLDGLYNLVQKWDALKPKLTGVDLRISARDSLLVPPLTATEPFSPMFTQSPISPDPNMLAFPVMEHTKLPTSPLLGVFSSGIRRRSRYHLRPTTRLKDTTQTSLLSILKSCRLNIATITLSGRGSSLDEYDISAQGISSAVCLSTPATCPLYNHWMGRVQHTESFDSDAYSVHFQLEHLSITHRKEGSLAPPAQLLFLQPLAVHIFASQWPDPWLKPATFLHGDLNAPFLAIQVTLDAVNWSCSLDQLDRLKSLFPAKEVPSSPQLKPPFQPRAPRFTIEFACDSITAQVYTDVEADAERHLVDLRTGGIVVNSGSTYKPATSSPTLAGHIPAQLGFTLSVHLEPIFVHARRTPTRLNSPDVSDPPYTALLEDPALISLESFGISGEGAFLTCPVDNDEHFPTLDLSTLNLDLHGSSDALCVELWHPVTLSVLGVLSSRFKSDPKPEREPRRDTSSIRLSLAFALPRSVVYITSPDLNPADTMELSRGLAVRTGILFQYATHQLPTEKRDDTDRNARWRQQLHLPERAIFAPKFEVEPQRPTSDCKVSLFGFVIRSAVSTRLEPDDPLIAERDAPRFIPQEFLRVPKVLLEFRVNRLPNNPEGPSPHTILEVSLKVPYIWYRFKTSHVYDVMLALRGIQGILPRTPKTKSTRQFRYRFEGAIPTVQIDWTLPKERLVMRFVSVKVIQTSDAPSWIHWDRLVAWVQMPEQPEEPWGELLAVNSVKLSISHSSQPLSISVDGDSARLHIPSGYVPANLIFDISVTLKAIRHLVGIHRIGSLSPMPTPSAEPPKQIPNITCQFNILSVDASDDDFETKLGHIWRTGASAVLQRIEREAAFSAKVAAISKVEQESSTGSEQNDNDYNFTAKHTVSIEDARQRLNGVHALDYALRLDTLREKSATAEDVIARKFRAPPLSPEAAAIEDLVRVRPIPRVAPLVRLVFFNLYVHVAQPSFKLDKLPDFLYDHGSGLPRDTQFSLLVPFHLDLTLGSLQATLRDYPLPLFNVPYHEDPAFPGLEFTSDIVVAEEVGDGSSVDWHSCPILEQNDGVYGVAPLSILVPKTTMPVKTYGNPVMRVTGSGVTTFSWCVSYGPATHDLMRVIESLTPPPLDSSPPLGFWDKMRLVLHGSIKISFAGEVRYYMKGSRDPYCVDGEGAGFVLAWKGSPNLVLNGENDAGEFAQLTSQSMIIAIPDLERITANTQRHQPSEALPYQKICGKLQAGVRFGIGVVLERACGDECLKCTGQAFYRNCRHFTSRPHFDIRPERKSSVPAPRSHEDSYNGFRSDFIHLSISLTSAIAPRRHQSRTSSLHLTPMTFTHFWSWWSLFNNVLSLPTRQGSLYPAARPTSPKLGRHLATLKYRIIIPELFLLHAYMDESRDTWTDGITPWIGVKGLIDHFQADLHQRDEETRQTEGPNKGKDSKPVRHKGFYAAEVVLKGADIRTMYAIFQEPLKRDVQVQSSPQRSNYRKRDNLATTDLGSIWYDPDDFVELTWTCPVPPTIHLLPLAQWPQFTYFKRNTARYRDAYLVSKFGIENSHACLLGEEPTALETQIRLTSKRIDELNNLIKTEEPEVHNSGSLRNMVALLEEYLSFLQDPASASSASTSQYHLPSETISPDEWAEFENVYHIHGLKIFMDSAIRDIMMQYYYCSRTRKGLEYHMATRAVKFIRDQAKVSLSSEWLQHEEGSRHSTDPAQMAASAIRRLLKVDTPKSSTESMPRPAPLFDSMDPFRGWSEGISVRKAHCCLLLNPQIVMRGEPNGKACVVAAILTKVQSYGIMDNTNLDDPISGKIMSRTYTSLSGLQTFAPARPQCSDPCVPLEVLIDYRCESQEFNRIVPQTHATFHYDKFNRLRLRNKVTSTLARPSTDRTSIEHQTHLNDQTDLIRIHVPKFTVTANDDHFHTISQVVTKLLLFSDATHKTRLDKLETLLFTYDFTDLGSAAAVVADLQSRLRSAMETERNAEIYHHKVEETGRLELLKLKAHIYLLSEELSLIFDAIKLAQDRYDGNTNQRSALLLHASSSEISWHMLDERPDLLAKLVVQRIHFYWLSRQDSSTANNLEVGDMQAFDGSQQAFWPEILSKHSEPQNHPLMKKKLFLLAHWVVLAPVGGITIYQTFELELHPFRLQIDARVGRRIMEYVWPARKNRRKTLEESQLESPINGPASPTVLQMRPLTPTRASLDSPRALHDVSDMPTQDALSVPVPSLRRLGVSRSFTDLRATAGFLQTPALLRNRSTDNLNQPPVPSSAPEGKPTKRAQKKAGDAKEMKTRSSQKSFVFVKISSLHLLLSVAKEGSFECRDAKIRTRDLEYRNQTWSFEELVNQFIPSNLNWRGWVKMAFHQPLIPVIPVARELISKTKWIKGGVFPDTDPANVARARITPSQGTEEGSSTPPTRHKGWRKLPLKTSKTESPSPAASIPLPSMPADPDQAEPDPQDPQPKRKRMRSLFKRTSPLVAGQSEASGSVVSPAVLT
ncbi:hypothetical protein BDN72DRAFT_809463 [Pluteus cervinus]|uniref:Uncharacterized protein n=1 Tax=Pluteus cervinus TaxID=181527 RepID=A0ACD3BDT5_9AGAR|nr:hypothetical protein BDN72DRAFT_809463 [Pluteus cervinus]